MRKTSAILTAVGLTLISGTGVRADVLVTRAIIHTGEVVRASVSGISIKVGQNEFTVARADILRADIKQPDAYDKSVAAVREGKYQEALAGFKTITDRYAGIPLPWVEDSVLQLGEVQVALKDFAGAKKTFDNFKVLYPNSLQAQVLDAKYARILFEQKEVDKARQLIQGVLEPLQKKEFLNEEQEASMAEGLVLLGDCDLVAGKTDDALDDYLKVVALYDVDTDRTAEARLKIGKILEQKGNWKRAKQTYSDLIKDNPEITYADDAKKRLAELTKAHPE